jgi:uncharacterized membrane protein YbjE (DUF340 family)
MWRMRKMEDKEKCDICEYRKERNIFERKDALVMFGILAALLLGWCLGWISHQSYPNYQSNYETTLQILKAAVMK